MAWAGNNQERALYLYGLNTAISESLYTPLQMLEVTMRNRFHMILSESLGDEWFERPEFFANRRQIDQLEKAKEKIRKAGKPLSVGRIVAELTLGFWTALV